MNNILSRRTIDGLDKLALGFPVGALKGAGSALTSAMGEDGYLVSASRAGAELSAACWRFESLVRDGDEALLLGSDAIGEAAGLDDPAGLEEGLSRLLVLARALSHLAARGSLPRGLSSSGLLVSRDGLRALVLPPAAVAKAVAARGERARRDAVARHSSPVSSGPEADASFILAQAAYRLAAGSGAFESQAGDSGEIVSLRHPLSLALAAPRLDPSLSALVDRALADPQKAALAEWIAVLEAASGSGWTRELPPQVEGELVKRRDEAQSRLRSQARRADFLRRRSTLLIGAGAVLVILALVFGDMARARMDRPDFSWLSPRELVQRYYLALDAMDLESLEACGDGKAIKEDDNYVMNLTVITKTRMAYEGKSPIVRAVDWLAAGRSALTANDFLYGITGLRLSGGDVPAGTPGAPVPPGTSVSIRAEYSSWTLDRGKDSSLEALAAPPPPLEEKRVDLLRLERGKKGWKIRSLERSRAL